jgi:hypothetical protein
MAIATEILPADPEHDRQERLGPRPDAQLAALGAG